MSLIAKIIVCDTFVQNYHKFRWKESIEMDLFIKKVCDDVEQQLRYLHRPYLKAKVLIWWKSVRLLTEYDQHTLILIPIFITDKNDKLRWENMIWQTLKDRIERLVEKIKSDLEHNRFEVFDR
jgi:hypothetical protein